MPRKKKAKEVAKKLGNFVEHKREQAIINIQNSTATGMFLKWLITNRVAVILSLIILLGYWHYRNETEYLREIADRARIEELQENLQEEKEKTEQLLKEIEKFNNDKSVSKEISEKVRDKYSSKSAEEKRKALLEYKDRLLKKRGLIQ